MCSQNNDYGHGPYPQSRGFLTREINVGNKPLARMEVVPVIHSICLGSSHPHILTSLKRDRNFVLLSGSLVALAKPNPSCRMASFFLCNSFGIPSTKRMARRMASKNLEQLWLPELLYVSESLISAS